MNNQIRGLTSIVKALASQINSTNPNNKRKTPPHMKDNTQDVVKRDALYDSDIQRSQNFISAILFATIIPKNESF